MNEELESTTEMTDAENTCETTTITIQNGNAPETRDAVKEAAVTGFIFGGAAYLAMKLIDGFRSLVQTIIGKVKAKKAAKAAEDNTASDNPEK